MGMEISSSGFPNSNVSTLPQAQAPIADENAPKAGLPPMRASNTMSADVQEPWGLDATALGMTDSDSLKSPAGMPKDLWDNCVASGKKMGIDPYILAAQMEKESQFGKALSGSPSGGDGLMQVEPSTRTTYASKFQEKMGHAYDHSSNQDQVSMTAVILADKGGSVTNMLQKYNGGDNWKPGTTDSYGREIKADEYAARVSARAEAMKSGAA